MAAPGEENYMGELQGNSVIVTGGASGIGRAATRLLAQAGYRITVADLDEVGGKAAVADAEAVGAVAQFVSTDVADEASVQAMVSAAEAAFGRLDAAINAAGVPGARKPFAELTAADFDAVQSINLRGMFLCIKYQIQAMQRAGAGSIVAISSKAGESGTPNCAQYCASKAGILGLVRGAALDYADKGIRVNAILPGATQTPMAKSALGSDPSLKKVIDRIPMKRFAQPTEVAAAAVWLISDQASYVTGASWLVDGALSLG
jgi:NAD(P)-dependent dehydrogenase (short-subunit alcohol dehydrogenase family)